MKKPLRCSAPKYVEYLMEWVQTTLDDERIFPTAPSDPFPSNIRDIIRTMFKRLFRVYAHMYLHHFDVLKTMGAEPHLNTCFRHFVLFVLEFDLIDSRVRGVPAPPPSCASLRAAGLGAHSHSAPSHAILLPAPLQELAPLQDLIDKLVEKTRNS